jgi:hypothetical protein
MPLENTELRKRLLHIGNQSRYVHCEMQVLGGKPFDGQSSNAGQGLPEARDFSIPFPAVSVQGRQC